MKLRTTAFSGMIALAGLSLVGVGAHAAFTASTASSQSVNAGTMSVVLQGSLGNEEGNNTNTLALATVGPTNSTYSTPDDNVTILNNGNVTITEITIAFTDPGDGASAADTALDAQSWACMWSDGSLIFNEPLDTVEGYGAITVGSQTIAPSSSDTYTVQVYAGATGTCGGAETGVSGGTFSTPDFYAPYSSFSPTNTTPPALGVNSGAASLTNAAEGGTITPTLTATYSA